MSRVPDLMLESALKPRAKALKDNGFGHEANMLDEAQAVMAEIAEHPPPLRNATLLIIPDIAREQLAAYGLIEPSDGQGVRWRLTARGNAMAEVLRATAPPEDPAKVAREAAQLERELRQTEAELDIHDADDDR
jgi:hypothetical protein